MKRIIYILLLAFICLNISAQESTDLSKGTFDVFIQDQSTDAIIFKFNRIDASTTLKYDASLNDTVIVLVDTAELDIDDYIILFNPVIERFFKGYCIDIIDDTLVVLDTPLDVGFDSGTFVDITTTNMAVDGSVTPQIFGLRGVSPSPLGVTVDITRIIFTCITNNTVDLSKFLDIDGGIRKGLILRKVNDKTFTILNVKTNQDIAGLMYDMKPFESTNPVQGQDGFISRFTFAGQNKVGVTIRLKPGSDLRFIVQDNLYEAGRLFEVVAEGHIVEY